MPWGWVVSASHNEIEDSPELWGQIAKVPHLVEVEDAGGEGSEK